MFVDGKQVTLTLKEFELLGRLVQNHNIVLTRDRLLEEVWGYDLTERHVQWMFMCGHSDRN